MLRYRVSNSQLKAQYFSSGKCSFWLKNAIGTHVPSMNCSRTALTDLSEASLVTKRSGHLDMGELVMWHWLVLSRFS